MVENGLHTEANAGFVGFYGFSEFGVFFASIISKAARDHFISNTKR